jgi:hypothetical protein
MAAVSRFVEFSVTSQTLLAGVSTQGASSEAKGTRGFSRGTGLTDANGEDSFTIVKDSNDDLTVSINGESYEITLSSGTDLDPRFVARDIEFRLHEASSSDNFTYAQCNWRNGNGGTAPIGPVEENSFIIYTGQLGNNAGSNDVKVSAGTNDARTTLGFNTVSEQAGADYAGSWAGTATISGSYGGQFDDHYTLMMSDNETVYDAVDTGGSTYNASNIQTGGLYTNPADTDYTITIDTTNGSQMGNGSTNVPRISWVSNPETDTGGPMELLYADHWYDIGTQGLRAKFQDAVFGDGDSYDITCSGASIASTSPGTTKYIWDSVLGDSSKAFSIPSKLTSVVPNQVGTRGVTVGFQATGTMAAGEILSVTCRGPQPLTEPVTQLNFGNVTVSTNSPVKTVWFEIVSGAVSMSTVKFSLQSDGTFQHHDQGDADTTFRFGTSGAGNAAPGSGATANDQVEYSVDGDSVGNIVATDIDDDVAPSYLYSTEANMQVVSSADLANDIGNYQGGLVSDFIWLAIGLGANETGANSTINYRMFFDFS